MEEGENIVPTLCVRGYIIYCVLLENGYLCWREIRMKRRVEGRCEWEEAGKWGGAGCHSGGGAAGGYNETKGWRRRKRRRRRRRRMRRR